MSETLDHSVSASAAPARLNGVDLERLNTLAEGVAADPSQGRTVWRARTVWRDGVRTRTRVGDLTIGSEEIARDFTLDSDEPRALCGTDANPNPQDYLLTALNACLTASFAAVCALQGVRLDSLEVETEGEIDLRGFLGLAPVAPGFESLRVIFRPRGGAGAERFAEILEMVRAASPNAHALANPVRIDASLAA